MLSLSSWLTICLFLLMLMSLSILFWLVWQNQKHHQSLLTLQFHLLKDLTNLSAAKDLSAYAQLQQIPSTAIQTISTSPISSQTDPDLSSETDVTEELLKTVLDRSAFQDFNLT